MRNIKHYLQNIHPPQEGTHKGQNGKLMIIGGSELFHAASKWSLDIASKFVDMVFYSSIPLNNELMKNVKLHFWNGIVIDRGSVEEYIQEADCILIGPGMTRERFVNDAWTKLLLSGQKWGFKQDSGSQGQLQYRLPPEKLSPEVLYQLKKTMMTGPWLEEGEAWENETFAWDHDTYGVCNYLLAKYPEKKWVIDAGALQMIEPALLNENVIITPHHKEIKMVFNNLQKWVQSVDVKQGAIKVGNTVYAAGYKQSFDGVNWQGEEATDFEDKEVQEMSAEIGGATVLLKGKEDLVFNADTLVKVEGGNPGMTKGGTGDVLAGLVAALYCTHDAVTAAVVGSYINKKAGDSLFEKVGPYFNASDLVNEIPAVFWEAVSKSK